jgi:hypothetical protein
MCNNPELFRSATRNSVTVAGQELGEKQCEHLCSKIRH